MDGTNAGSCWLELWDDVMAHIRGRLLYQLRFPIMFPTIPELVAVKILAARPHLRAKPLPLGLKIQGSHAEFLWPAVADDDEPCKFVRAKIREIAKTVEGTKRSPVS